MNTAKEIHGHQVIEIVASHREGVCAHHLERDIGRRFGRSARFHTCTAAGMSFHELLVFLEARHKIRVAGEMVFPGPSPACGDHA